MALIKIAGVRWAVEESIQAAKGQVGLDHYQVRGWRAWHRHITLAMLALALLAAIAAAQPPDADDRIRLTLPEIRRSLAALILTTPPRSQTSCAGQTGDVAIRQSPDTATTSADPNHDRDVSLEY